MDQKHFILKFQERVKDAGREGQGERNTRVLQKKGNNRRGWRGSRVRKAEKEEEGKGKFSFFLKDWAGKKEEKAREEEEMSREKSIGGGKGRRDYRNYYTLFYSRKKGKKPGVISTTEGGAREGGWQDVNYHRISGGKHAPLPLRNRGGPKRGGDPYETAVEEEGSRVSNSAKQGFPSFRWDLRENGIPLPSYVTSHKKTKGRE